MMLWTELSTALAARLAQDTRLLFPASSSISKHFKVKVGRVATLPSPLHTESQTNVGFQTVRKLRP